MIIELNDNAGILCLILLALANFIGFCSGYSQCQRDNPKKEETKP